METWFSDRKAVGVLEKPFYGVLGAKASMREIQERKGGEITASPAVLI